MFFLTNYQVKQKTILPEEFIKMYNDNPDSFVLIDVRPPDKKEEGIIKGSKSIPFGVLGKRINELDKDDQIITQCQVGRMSYVAYRKLINNGFTNVRYLDGGVISWPGELVTSEN